MYKHLYFTSLLSCLCIGSTMHAMEEDEQHFNQLLAIQAETFQNIHNLQELNLHNNDNEVIRSEKKGKKQERSVLKSIFKNSSHNATRPVDKIKSVQLVDTIQNNAQIKETADLIKGKELHNVKRLDFITLPFVFGYANTIAGGVFGIKYKASVASGIFTGTAITWYLQKNQPGIKKLLVLTGGGLGTVCGTMTNLWLFASNQVSDPSNVTLYGNDTLSE